jgi:hypothetical protein
MISQKLEATNFETRRNGVPIPSMTFSTNPVKWSCLFFNEETMQLRWAELHTSDAQLKRMAYGGFSADGSLTSRTQENV